MMAYLDAFWVTNFFVIELRIKLLKIETRDSDLENVVWDFSSIEKRLNGISVKALITRRKMRGRREMTERDRKMWLDTLSEGPNVWIMTSFGAIQIATSKVSQNRAFVAYETREMW